MKIEDVFVKLRPIWGRQLDKLWQEYLVAEPPLRKTIEKILRVKLARQLGETYQSEQVLLQPPPEKLAGGKYPAGSIHYGKDRYYEFGLKEEEFIQHIGIFGRSGSGKTNLAFLILQGLAGNNKPFLVFDWKRNYRDLLSRPEFSDVLVFTVGRDIVPFRFNPLIPPPGTSARVWLKKLIEIMAHAYYLGEGVSILLLRAIDSLYNSHGLYAGQPDTYPTMASVRNWLLEYGPKGRERGWMESAMRAVETLCFGEVGNVLNSGPFVDIAKLLDRKAVLELDALTNADKTFLIEALLLWIHHYRMAEGNREQFKHATIIEEAHHILLRKKQEATGEETVTDVMLREIRELGESIICLDQHPSLISKPALGNTYTTFAFNLKHRGDLAMMQDCLLLDKEQTGYLGRLEVGWAAVKLQGRWFFPFLVMVPLIDIKKGGMTDEALRQRFGRHERTEKLYMEQKAISGPISENPAVSGQATTKDGPDKRFPDRGKVEKEGNGRGGKCTIRLTTQERDFMWDIWHYATSPVTQRYRRLGFSFRSGNSIKNHLFEFGLLVVTPVLFFNTTMKLLSLTKKGRKYIGLDEEQTDRHGGVVHKFWVEKIAELLESKGYSVEREVSAGGGMSIDIVAAKDDARIAFEIETGKSDILKNIRKCREAGFSNIIIAATSKQAEKRIKTRLKPSENVTVIRANRLLRRNYLNVNIQI